MIRMCRPARTARLEMNHTAGSYRGAIRFQPVRPAKRWRARNRCCVRPRVHGRECRDGPVPVYRATRVVGTGASFAHLTVVSFPSKPSCRRFSVERRRSGQQPATSETVKCRIKRIGITMQHRAMAAVSWVQRHFRWHHCPKEISECWTARTEACKNVLILSLFQGFGSRICRK